MPEYVDPRAFLSAEKIASIKSRTRMNDAELSKAFVQLDSLIKDSPASRYNGEEKRGDDMAWQLMGVLGSDSTEGVISLRQVRVQREKKELLSLKSVQGRPLLFEFLSNIDSVRMMPGTVEIYSQYADDIHAAAALKKKESLIGELGKITEQRLTAILGPEGPPQETAQSLYHKLRLLESIKSWAKQ